MMRTMAGPLTVISLFWYGSAHWQVTPSLSLISFTNSHVLYFFISFIFSLFLHSNAANILMFLILIPWYLFSVHILFRLNSDLGGVKVIPEGSGADVKYYAQLGADAASKKLLGRPEISFYDVSFSLPINSTKVINLDDYIDNGILVGALIKSFSAPWTPANQSFTSSLLNNKVSIDYRANDSGFSASLTLGLYYYVP